MKILPLLWFLKWQTAFPSCAMKLPAVSQCLGWVAAGSCFHPQVRFKVNSGASLLFRNRAWVKIRLCASRDGLELCLPPSQGLTQSLTVAFLLSRSLFHLAHKRSTFLSAEASVALLPACSLVWLCLRHSLSCHRPAHQAH